MFSGRFIHIRGGWSPAALRLIHCAMIATFLLVASLLFATPALALTESGEIDGVRYTVYAPDWIWQKNAVNVLVVLENESAADASVFLALVMWQGELEAFEHDRADEENRAVTVPAGQTVRHAFTNILARGDAPLQTYNFEIAVQTDDDLHKVAYPLKTIRGPVVSSAEWAALLPAIICGLCCFVFIFFLRTHTTPGAWKTPSDPVSAPENPEPWITRKP